MTFLGFNEKGLTQEEIRTIQQQQEGNFDEAISIPHLSEAVSEINLKRIMESGLIPE